MVLLYDGRPARSNRSEIIDIAQPTYIRIVLCLVAILIKLVVVIVNILGQIDLLPVESKSVCPNAILQRTLALRFATSACS